MRLVNKNVRKINNKCKYKLINVKIKVKITQI